MEKTRPPFVRWKQACCCAEAAQRDKSAAAFLLRIPLDNRFEVAARILCHGDRGGQAAGPVTSAMRRKRPTTVSGPHVVMGHNQTRALQQILSLFDHFGGAAERRKRNLETESFGSLEVDDRFIRQHSHGEIACNFITQSSGDSELTAARPCASLRGIWPLGRVYTVRTFRSTQSINRDAIPLIAPALREPRRFDPPAPSSQCESDNPR